MVVLVLYLFVVKLVEFPLNRDFGFNVSFLLISACSAGVKLG